MKEEIERILKGNNVDLGGVAWDDLVEELQKLFLSKQIELFRSMLESPHGVRYEIARKLAQLESELKQLQ